MTEGLLEYLIVHQNGKVHESLLSTEVSPTHLNLAFTLLRYPASKELYPLPNETGGVSDKFPEVPADVKAAARVTIDVEWTDDGKVRRVPVNEWIQHAVKATAMPAGPWVYGGSDFHEGKFVAETTWRHRRHFPVDGRTHQLSWRRQHATTTVWVAVSQTRSTSKEQTSPSSSLPTQTAQTTPETMKLLSSLIILGTAIGSAAENNPMRYESLKQEIRQSIARGNAWLKSQQKPDGHWDDDGTARLHRARPHCRHPRSKPGSQGPVSRAHREGIHLAARPAEGRRRHLQPRPLRL